jgi:hypothetical protein
MTQSVRTAEKESMTAEDPPDVNQDREAVFLEQLRAGIRDADDGRLDAAEARFRQLLASVRGTGTRPERLAASSLLTLFAHEGRDVEALVLARRHLALSAANGDPEDVCFGCASLVDALDRLEDWRRFDVAAAEFERALDAYAGRHNAALRRHLLRTMIHRELARGQGAAASALLARVHALDATDPDPPDIARATRLCEAEIGLATGRPDRARVALGRLAASVTVVSLEAEFLAARCALAIEGPAAAITAIGRVVDSLESPVARTSGVATRLSVARRAAQLADRVGAGFDLTKRAFDVAAAMVLLRASEIERAAREMPELADVDPQDARALAAYRVRFASEQKELLAAVADLLRKRAAAGDLPSWAAGSADGAARVCPWCLRVRTPDGSMLPIGHYLPSGPGLRVDHGVCETCAARTKPA